MPRQFYTFVKSKCDSIAIFYFEHKFQDIYICNQKDEINMQNSDIENIYNWEIQESCKIIPNQMEKYKLIAKISNQDLPELKVFAKCDDSGDILPLFYIIRTVEIYGRNTSVAKNSLITFEQAAKMLKSDAILKDIYKNAIKFSSLEKII